MVCLETGYIDKRLAVTIASYIHIAILCCYYAATQQKMLIGENVGRIQFEEENFGN